MATPLLKPPADSPFAPIVAFFMEYGRYPHITDDPRPWHYKGWLLTYVLEIHAAHPDVPDRWGYWMRTREAGRLLDEPIPQIHFDTPDRRAYNAIEKHLDILFPQFGSWSSFRAFVEWLGWGLGARNEESEIREDLHEQLYRQVDIGPWLLEPYDYLGAFLTEHRAKGWNPSGFYPTPHHVVEMMVQIQIADESEDMRVKTVCDPCVGTGRMLLHASNHSLRLYGQDIDGLVLEICKINGALYAPWLSFPFPEEYFPPEPGHPVPVPQRCPTCFGTGEIRGRKTIRCPKCRGTGRKPTT